MAYITLVIVVAGEHWNAYTRVRSWNYGVLALFIFSLLNHLLDVILVEYMLGKEINHRQFTEIMVELKFWAVIFVAVTISVIPLYLFKVFKMVIHKPQFF